jgi:hypothetical protein
MRPHATHNLFSIDRLATPTPAYGGHRGPAHRRGGEGALRTNLAGRLALAHLHLDEAIARCGERDAGANSNGNTPSQPEGHRLLTLIAARERVREHLIGIAARLAVSPGADIEAPAGARSPAAADAASQRARDLGPLDLAETLVRWFEEPDRRQDFLADLETDRAILARRIDERTLLRADLAAGRVP